MTVDDWVPFGLDEEAERDYRTLIGGVPEWLRESLVEWVLSVVNAGGSWCKAPMIREVQRRTGIAMPAPAGSDIVPKSAMIRHLREMEDMSFLRVIDCLLATTYQTSTAQDRLNAMLKEGRSRYEVGQRGQHLGLVERVEQGVRDYVEGVIASHDTAGKLLARAWYNVHALQPNDTQAYADAVRAVEIVAAPLVEPNNEESTLGNIASVMRTQGNWRLGIRSHKHSPSGEMLVMMCRNLYRGQSDRHGRPDYSDVTHGEARIGVSLAATLVDWFASGAVYRDGGDGIA